MTQQVRHPLFSRRVALQAGGISLLGLGVGDLETLQAYTAPPVTKKRSVIYIFLSGGLSQLESFDPKPAAPDAIRGEFGVIATRTPGLTICEHLPRLAACSNLWSVVRSLTHSSNDHSAGHHIMLTGRSDLPVGFDPNKPQSTDHPSLAALATRLLPANNNLPPAIVLPEKLIHHTGRVIPGQFGGVLGPRANPWLLEASPYEPRAYGAFPEYEFDHQQRDYKPRRHRFTMPDLTLPDNLSSQRFAQRMELLKHIDQQRRALALQLESHSFSRRWTDAVGLLTDPRVRRAFDLSNAPLDQLERYGNNSFGWSLWMAARLAETGVRLIQVNLGNNETWDTHGNAFPHLKDKLLPPMDRAVSSLLQDLNEQGLLEQTLVVMASEFGRTPKTSTLSQFYKGPGRDHWGAVQSVLLAGGGIPGGCIYGASDKHAAYPLDAACTPEDLAATIFSALGLPSHLEYHDTLNRPHQLYRGVPLRFG
ncbi:MAG: hypothetical protein KatS3mg113_0365 [Planctomycetaceae bacterium]|nr:MAG: hypothetical protein KatS3mg113_0365 [Planctomycetaceae bacterium]